jgi:hypothetical protein
VCVDYTFDQAQSQEKKLNKSNFCQHNGPQNKDKIEILATFFEMRLK